jgi:murein DD-endopeptidase MepM/ murein hydrolase activator NlpD
MSDRTLKVTSPHMTGRDVSAWQTSLNLQMRRWDADDLIEVDGDYGLATRSYTSKVLYGLGIAQSKMAEGVTPELRKKVRDRSLTPVERARYVKRTGWRRDLHGKNVSSPLVKILADSWGYHPGVHDGMDLISEPDAVIHSMTNGTVVRVSPSGWWGLGAPSDPALKAKGDGIVIVRCAEDVGPFKRGMNVCYGHAEKATVKEGQKVVAGQPIAHTGFAVAWHIHLMINDDPPSNGFYKGVGDRDPRPYYDYARKNG